MKKELTKEQLVQEVKILNNKVLGWFINEGFEIEISENVISLTYKFERPARLLMIHIKKYKYMEINYYEVDEYDNLINLEVYTMNYVLQKKLNKLIEELIKIEFIHYDENDWR